MKKIATKRIKKTNDPFFPDLDTKKVGKGRGARKSGLAAIKPRDSLREPEVVFSKS